MPASVTARFTIQGDVSGAVSAATEFSKQITSLNRRMTSLASKAPQVNQFSQVLRQFNTTLSAFSRRAPQVESSANRMAAAFDRMGASYSRLLTTMQTPLPQQASAVTPTRTTAPATQAVSQISRETERARNVVSSSVANMIGQFSGLYRYLCQGQGVFEALGQSGYGAFSKIGGILGTVLGKATPLLLVMDVGWRAISGVIDHARRTLENFGKSLEKIKVSNYSTFATAQRFFMNLTDGLRLITLGLTNIARSMMFFISIPLSGFIYNVGRQVLEFDDNLKGVQKTTGLLNTDMPILSGELRKLAKTTALTVNELGLMAQQAGQLGLHTVRGITGLVKIGNMLAISTDLAAETVVESLGRIANAFSWNLDKSSKEVERMANVINMLENETAASAAEIVESILGFAPVSAFLKITAADTAALGATLIGAGYDASKAATALRNVGIYMVKNREDVVRLLGGWEKYNTVSKLSNALTEDFVGTMFDFILAAAQQGDTLEVLSEVFDIFNLRGGRAIATFSNNVGALHRNLRIARDEWKMNNSLMIEYDRAMSSTQNQLKLLNNHMIDFGITIGETVLPVLNRLIQHVIPLVEIAADAFSKLDKNTQLWAVATLFALAIAGPFLMFLAQTVHGIFLIGMGFATLMRLVPTLINVLLNIGQTLISIVGLFFGFPMKIGIAVFGILKILSKLGVDVASIFTNLADAALSWGEKLAAEYASGLLQGAVKWISKAIAAICNMIASFFASHSPPEKGPLREIQKWGRALLETYLRGFALADFSILEDVGGIIQNILQNWVTMEKIKEPDMYVMLARAKVMLSKLIDEFNRTGVISKSVLDDIVSGLGDYKDDVKDLILAWEKYQQIQKALADIESRRASLKRTYTEEMKAIATSGKHIEERVSLMRDAIAQHNKELTLLDEQEEALKAQEEQYKDNLEWQQAFLRALTAQDDLFSRLTDVLERLEEKLKGAGGATPEFEFGEPGMDWSDLDDAYDEFKRYREELYNLQSRIGEAKESIMAFWRALRGEPLDVTGRGEDFYRKNVGQEQWRELTDFYEKGELVREQLVKLQGLIDAIKGTHVSGPEWESMTPEQQKNYDEVFNRVFEIKQNFDDLKASVNGAISEVQKFWSEAFPKEETRFDYQKGEGNLPDKLKGAFAYGKYKVSELPFIKFFIEFKKSWDDNVAKPWEDIKKQWNEIQTDMETIRKNLAALFSGGEVDADEGLGFDWSKLGENLGTQFGDLAGGIGAGLLEALSGILAGPALITGIGEAITTLFTTIASNPSGWTNAIGEFAGKIVEEFCKWFIDSFGSAIDIVLPDLREDMETWAKEGILGGLFSEGGLQDYEFLSQKIEEFVTNFLDFWKEKLGISSPSTKMEEIGEDILLGLIQGLDNKWEELITNVKTRIDEVVDKIESYQDTFKKKGEELRDKIKDGLTTSWEKTKTDLGTRLTEVKTKIEGFRQSFREKGDELRQKIEDGLVDTTAWENVKTLVYNKLIEVKNKIVGMWDIFKAAGVDVVNGLKEGAEQAINAFLLTIPNIIRMIIREVKEALGVEESPSYKTAEMGVDLGLGLIEGVNAVSVKTIDKVAAVFTSFQDSASNALLAGWDEDFSALGKILIDGANSLATNSTAFYNLGSSLGDAVVEGMNGTLDTLKHIDLDNIVGGVSSGAGKIAGQVTDNITQPVEEGVYELRDGMKVMSPSKVTEEIGQNIGLGFIIGLQKANQLMKANNLKLFGGLPGWDHAYGGYSPLAAPDFGANTGGINLQININNPTVRSDDDIRKLAREVKRVINNEVIASNRMGGSLS